MTWRDKLAPELQDDAAFRRDNTHVTKEQSPVGIGVDAQQPDTMPRGEDDVITRAGSRDVHDQPGSGSDIARRQQFFMHGQ